MCPAQVSKEDLDLLQQFLVEESGLFFNESRRQPLHDAVSQRLQRLGNISVGEYLNLIRFQPDREEELMSLYRLLTVGETYFFRNPAQFEVFRDSVIPDLVARQGDNDRTITFWSAGSATGEEPYTAAIILKEHLPEFSSWDVSILGTDINQDFLRRAREGIYSPRSVSHVPAPYLDKYFTRRDNAFLLSDEIKRLVKFEYHNLVRDPFSLAGMRKADVVFCRNVIIYFEPQKVKKVIDKFYHMLSGSGYLFLGESETLWHISSDFKIIDFPRAFIYQKSPVPVREKAAPIFDIPSIKFEDLRLPAMPVNAAVPLPKKVEKAFEAAIDAKVSLAKAYELANQGKYEAAIEELKKIIKADNLFVEAYYLMGILYQRVGKLDDAVRELQRAVYVDPALSIAYYVLGNIYLFQGKTARAKKEIEHSVRLLKCRSGEELVAFSETLTCELLLIACKRMLEKTEKTG